MSKQTIVKYVCDRCGEEMESPYATFILKHVGLVSAHDEYVNKDFCEDCYKKIDLVMNDKKALIISGKSLGNWSISKNSYNEDIPPSLRGTYVTWTGNDPINKESGTWKTDFLNKHLDVMCV